jgi:hypothetical protein
MENVSEEQAQKNVERYHELVEQLSSHIVVVCDGQAYGPYMNRDDAEADWIGEDAEYYNMNPPVEFVVALMAAADEAGL